MSNTNTNTNTNPSLPQQSPTEEERTEQVSRLLSQHAWDREQESHRRALQTSQLQHETRLTQAALDNINRVHATEAFVAPAQQPTVIVPAPTPQGDAPQDPQLVFHRTRGGKVIDGRRRKAKVRKVTCPYCRRELANRNSLTRHVRMKHPFVDPVEVRKRLEQEKEEWL